MVRRRERKSPEEKRRGARKGAFALVVGTGLALALAISTDSCAGEEYRRLNLTTLLTGDPEYARRRITTCGFVRTVAPDSVDRVPCQVWNFMPLTGLALFAAGWLLLDLLGLSTARTARKEPRDRPTRRTPHDRSG
jgi:hypothetical protein